MLTLCDDCTARFEKSLVPVALPVLPFVEMDIPERLKADKP